MKNERYYFHDSDDEVGGGSASGAEEEPEVQETVRKEEEQGRDGFAESEDIPERGKEEEQGRDGFAEPEDIPERGKEEEQGRDGFAEPEDILERGKEDGAGRAKRNRPALAFTAFLTLFLVGSMGYYGLKYGLRSGSDTAGREGEPMTLGDFTAGEPAADPDDTRRAAVLDVSGVVAEVLPSVVAITNTSIQEIEYWFETMEFENSVSGSGFIIAKTGDEILIATNAHVVDGASSLSVCFTVGSDADSDTAVAEAVVKGMDTVQDLAVLAVSAQDLPKDVRDRITVARLGVSSELLVGEPAIAIGNALGYGQSVTLGIISALNREVTIDGNTSRFIQTDAAINEGNSGGVLLDVDGRVVGISFAKISSQTAARMGYAIPIDDAKPVLEELMNKVTRMKVGEEEKGYLGISPRDISEEGRSLYHMPAGVFVYGVEEGSPAEEAGIRAGDVITRFDGNTVDSSERLIELMEYYAAGEEVEVELQSNTEGIYETRRVSVVLG